MKFINEGKRGKDYRKATSVIQEKSSTTDEIGRHHKVSVIRVKREEEDWTEPDITIEPDPMDSDE